MAEVETPLGLLMAVTSYEPAATFATRKVPFSCPLESEQLISVTTCPVSVQLVSVEAKPEPETWIAAPTGAEVSLNDNDSEVVSVKVCEAESLYWMPVTVIV